MEIKNKNKKKRNPKAQDKITSTKDQIRLSPLYKIGMKTGIYETNCSYFAHDTSHEVLLYKPV